MAGHLTSCLLSPVSSKKTVVGRRRSPTGRMRGDHRADRLPPEHRTAAGQLDLPVPGGEHGAAWADVDGRTVDIELHGRATRALERLAQLPEVIRGFFRDPSLAYIGMP